MTEKRKHRIIISTLCAAVILMGIGFAAFSTALDIEGTARIDSNWCVKISGIKGKDATSGATDKASPTFTDTRATFSTSLLVPGDSKSYDVTITNCGNVNAKLGTLTEDKGTNSAILFEGSGITEGTVLTPGDTATYTAKVTYNPAVTQQPSVITSNFAVTFDFVQSA